MSKISVTVCRKDGRPNYGSEGASCTIERDIDDDMLERPALTAQFIESMYMIAEASVAGKLASSTPRPKIQPMTQAEVDTPDPRYPAPRPAAPPASIPPSTPSTPPPVGQPPPGKRTFYGNDGAPKSGKGLFGWAKDRGAVAWFEDLGRRQVPPLPKMLAEWSADWVTYAVAEYGKACIPPVPSANGNGHPPY